jgi:hypothetical protein
VKVFTNFVLWPHFEAGWPTNRPAHVGGIDGIFRTIPAIGIPMPTRRSCSPALTITSPTTPCGPKLAALALTFL